MRRKACLIHLLLVLVLLSACTTSRRPGNDAALRDIDAFVTRTLRTLPELPSVGLTIVEDGKVYTRGYGYADLEHRIAAGPDTGYYNGSNTKAYTATVVATLAAEGVLDLDAPITKYLPEVQFAASIDASRLTLRRFLSHMSGIRNEAITFRTAYAGNHTPEELVRILGRSAAAKDEFYYDNLGYVVAGLVIERLTGRKWQDVLDQRLFHPLNMRNTTTSMSVARKRPIAVPYAMNDRGVLARLEYGWKDNSMMHAAGGIVTTPNDLARWLSANLTDGRIGSRQLLPASAFQETRRQQTPVKGGSPLFAHTGYGFGWYQSTWRGTPLLFHGGGFEGWRSFSSFIPERRLAIGVMTNSSLGNAPLEMISAYAYGRLAGLPDVDATYDKRIAEVRARFDRIATNIVAEVNKRAQRAWTLTHPRSAYVGRYEGPTYGTLTIEERGDRLVASIGHLSSELQPYTNPESARVELIPGNGEILQFQFSSGAGADAVKWRDEVMVRSPSAANVQ